MKALKITLLLLSSLLLSSCIINEKDIETEVDLVYSSTITVRSGDFHSENEYITVAAYGWSNLDEYMVDNGLVLGYLRLEGSTAWHALPFAVPFENDMINLRYSFDIEDFSLILEGEVAGNNAANAALFDGDVLRIIAIPPDQIIRGKGFDYRDYHQVVSFYGIEP